MNESINSSRRKKIDSFFSLQNRNFIIMYIFTLFFSLSVYNHTNFLVRPTEFFIPILFIVVIINVKKHIEILVIGILLLSYLLAVELINNGLSDVGYALSNLRYWLYAVIFICLAQTFATIDLQQNKKVIQKAVISAILFIILIYILIDNGNSFIRNYFGSYLINEELAVEEGVRIAGVSASFFTTGLFLTYFMNASRIFRYALVMGAIILFYFSGSRQFLVTFFIVYIFLFFSKKDFFLLLAIFLFGFGTILTYVQSQLSNGDFTYMAGRIFELLYFYNSPSILGRLNDTMYFIDNWIDNPWNFTIGYGLSYQLEYVRYYFEFDNESGITNFFYNIAYAQSRHNADNLISLLITEGGIILLLFIVFLVIFWACKILKADKRVGSAFIFMVLATSFVSIHAITNYIIVFTLSYLYFYSKNIIQRQVV